MVCLQKVSEIQTESANNTSDRPTFKIRFPTITHVTYIKDDEEEETITIKKVVREICPNKQERRIYTSKQKTGADITMIEILPKDNLPDSVKFLEADDSYKLPGGFNNYKNQTICTIGYPHYDPISNKDQKISFGSITELGGLKRNDNYLFLHNCSTEGGASGAPIINTSTMKVIGLHHGGRVVKDEFGNEIISNHGINEASFVTYGIHMMNAAAAGANKMTTSQIQNNPNIENVIEAEYEVKDEQFYPTMKKRNDKDAPKKNRKWILNNYNSDYPSTTFRPSGLISIINGVSFLITFSTSENRGIFSFVSNRLYS